MATACIANDPGDDRRPHEIEGVRMDVSHKNGTKQTHWQALLS